MQNASKRKDKIQPMKTILLMSITADGKIAKTPNQLIDWTEKEDKKYFVNETKSSGVVLMGNNTYKTIKKPLTDRLNIVFTKDKNKKSDNGNLIFTSLDPKIVIDRLKDTKIFKSLVLIGGETINTTFAKEGLIDQIHLTISPYLFGTGLSLFNEELNMKLNLVDFDRIGKNSLLVIYGVEK